MNRTDLLSRRTLFPVLAFVGFNALWEVGVSAADIKPYILPPPSEILVAMTEEYPLILEQLLISLREFAVAFSMTILFGYLLAVVLSQWKTLEMIVYPYVIVAKSIPVITLLPVFILWIGFGFPSIVAISFLISFFAMVVNSLSGFKSTDEECVEMIRSFSGSRWDVFRHVHLYSSLPSVFAGIKICVILTFTGVIVGEFQIGTKGIGYLIIEYTNSYATAEMFASILVISTTGLILFGIVVLIERRVVSWNSGTSAGL